MEGAAPPIDWVALAPHIEHKARASIVEALRWIGPLSAPDLKSVLDDPEFHLTYVAYHVTALVREEVLTEIGQQPSGAPVEKAYFFAPPK